MPKAKKRSGSGRSESKKEEGDDDGSIASKSDQPQAERGRKTTEENGIETLFPPASAGSQVLTLNIGGKETVQTMRSTLTIAAGSKLAEMFSGRWDESLPKDKDGNYFIDRRPDIFLPLLEFLRDLSSMAPPEYNLVPPMTPIFNDPNSEASFRRMVDGYDLINVLYNYELYRVSGSPLRLWDKVFVSHHCSIFDFAMEKADNSPTYSCYLLGRPEIDLGKCHGRPVQSFEIRVSRNANGHIGWAGEAAKCLLVLDINAWKVYYTSMAPESSSAVPSRSCKSIIEETTDGLSIRCIQQPGTGNFKWYVNGTLVAATDSICKGKEDMDGPYLRVGWNAPEGCEMLPMVQVGSGSFRFSALQLAI